MEVRRCHREVPEAVFLLRAVVTLDDVSLMTSCDCCELVNELLCYHMMDDLLL